MKPIIQDLTPYPFSPIALCIGAVQVKLRMNKIIIKAIMKLAPNKSLERTITRLHALRAASSCPPLSARCYVS